MSYLSSLIARFGKRPIWLYLVQNGSNVFFRTSRANADFVEEGLDFFDDLDFFAESDFFDRTWSASGIQHARFDRSSMIPRSEVPVTIPRTDAAGAAFVGGVSDDEGSVTIFHEFLNDADSERVVKFRGRVVAVQEQREVVSLTCESGMTTLRDKALAAVIQGPCQNVVYTSVGDYGCRLNFDDWAATGACTSLVGRTVTCAAAADRADGYYSGGILRFDGRNRQILRHTGSELVLMSSFPALSQFLASASPSVAEIQIAPGCRLTRSNCQQFNNLLNFFGFPWADESPYDGRTLY
jgi:hypothetical protein